MHASLGNVVALMPGIREIHAARGDRREPWPPFEPVAGAECSTKVLDKNGGRTLRQSANDATSDQIRDARMREWKMRTSALVLD